MRQKTWLSRHPLLEVLLVYIVFQSLFTRLLILGLPVIADHSGHCPSLFSESLYSNGWTGTNLPLIL